MRMTLTAALAACALFSLGAAAPAVAGEAPPKPPRSCFWTQEVSGFTVADDRTVYLHVGTREVYRLDLFGSCPDARWEQTIALESRPGSSICSALDATLITNGPTGAQRCAVSKLTRLTPEEAASIGKKR